MAVRKYKPAYIPHQTETRLAATFAKTERLVARVQAALDETKLLIETAKEVVEESKERRRQRRRTPAS